MSTRKAPRKAQLIAESVSVCCPHCGEAQPDKNGSELWTEESFIHKQGKFMCVSCEEEMSIWTGSTAQFGGR